MSADDIDIMLETLAREERDEADRAHGQHILGMIADASSRREEQSRLLLDAMNRANQAERGEQGD